MRITAYTYDADVHCPACAAHAYPANHSFPACRTAQVSNNTGAPDEHGVGIHAHDLEENPIHPVFSTDEHDFTHCGDCHQVIA